MTLAAIRSARARALAVVLGLFLAAGATAAAGPVHAETGQKVMLKGATTASYYWDDGSGRAGDTGLPASGKPMQKGLAASPSWPLLTEGYVLYKGRKAPFFVGDRGPGEPSNRGIMLDLDAKTFAQLTGGTFDPDTLTVRGNGGAGHIKVDYVITKWGPGVGKKNHPVPFSTGAYKVKDDNPAEPVALSQSAAATPERASSSARGATGKTSSGTPAATGDRATGSKARETAPASPGGKPATGSTGTVTGNTATGNPVTGNTATGSTGTANTAATGTGAGTPSAPASPGQTPAAGTPAPSAPPAPAAASTPAAPGRTLGRTPGTTPDIEAELAQAEAVAAAAAATGDSDGVSAEFLIFVLAVGGGAAYAGGRLLGDG
ncbi:hypothetical protein Psi01_40960 [Planobispora siamensis]|uniref:Uncharacterized protein n=1 Tax=Planobispora siamensis TaxID=936338 RepID=A0A8J3WN44_9ACTN|nr:hypothetical protein [Planobispora siamensis]GIH93466.1 hypothetical protein Psi01_40960 [Planobispora siamensis]